MTFVVVSVAMFAQRPELVVQTGHSEHVNAIAFSPDGGYLASGGYDGTTILWNVGTGEQLRVFETDSKPISGIAFSPDGRLLATVGDDSARIFDVRSGIEKRGIEEQRSLSSIAFSPDGTSLATGGTYGDVLITKIDTAEQAGKFEVEGLVESLAFSPDGRYLAGGKRLWDLRSGQEVRRLGRLVAFSPDGTDMANTSREDLNLVVLFNNETGKEIRRFAGHSEIITALAFSADGRYLATASDDKTIRVWDVRTGAAVRKLSEGLDSVISVALSPDGRYVAGSIGGIGKDHTVRLWNVSTGNTERQFAGHTAGVEAVAFSGDRKFIATSNGDETARLWDTSAGGLIKTFGDQNNRVLSMAISPDGRTVAGGNFDNTIHLWSAENGSEIRRLVGHTEFVRSVAFSPDGKRLISSSWDQTVRLWDPDTGRAIKVLRGYQGVAESVSFSPDGRYILVRGGSDETVRLWNATTGTQVFSYDDVPYTTAFSPDSRSFASADHSILLWSTETGAQEWIFDGDFRSVAFSPGGEYLAGGGREIVLLDPRSGKELKRFGNVSGWVQSLAFSPDGRYLAAGGTDGPVHLWEVKSGAEVASLIAMGANDWLVTTPDGFFDGTPGAWKQLLWRFNGDTFDHAPAETYFNDFFYPGLLQDVFAGRSPRPKPGQELSKIDRRQPKVEIARINGLTKDTIAAEPERRLSTFYRRAIVEIDVADNSGAKNAPSNPPTSGAQDLRLFRNGSLVAVWHGDVFRSDSGCKTIPPAADATRKVRCAAVVSLTPGDNSFTAYAFNSSNIRSTDVPFSMKGRDSNERSGVFYILAIGVDKYADPSLNLNFAVADAIEAAKAIARQQQKLSNKKYASTQLISLTDDLATKDNILAALSRFKNVDEHSIPDGTSPALKTELEKIKRAEPEDVLVIYYAGHGVAAGDRFYLLPHDFEHRTAQGFVGKGISDLELTSILEEIDAGKMLMSIDACQSGQALGKANEGKAPMNSKGLAQLAYDKGMFILTAAQSQQAALEVSRFGHGLLTYALLEGLQKADTNADGEIVERKWLDYAVRSVPGLQLEEMRKRDDQIKKDPSKRGAEIVFVIGANKSLPPEKRGLQTPRVFYRQELGSSPLVIARP